MSNSKLNALKEEILKLVSKKVGEAGSEHILLQYKKDISAALSKDQVIKVKFENHIVCFLDVMGFTNLLKSKDVEDRITEYINAVWDNDEVVRKHIYPEIEIISISDSIIIASKLTNTEKDLEMLGNFLGVVATIQYNLATLQAIWTRGAIAIGGAHIDSSRNMVFGPGYLNAYEMESAADYPRVVLHPSVTEFFKMNPVDFSKKLIELQAPVLPFRFNPPINHPTFESDFIMIDWLCVGFIANDVQPYADFSGTKPIRDLEMNMFFADFEKRQFVSPEIFRKSRKFLMYMVVSISHNRENIAGKGFMEKVLNRVEELTGFRSIRKL